MSVPRYDATRGGASAPLPYTYERYLAEYKPQALDDGRLSEPMSRADWREVYGSLNEAPPPVDMTSAAYFCAEAARLVGGDRATTHGDKTLNFHNIAELWNGYWRIKCRVEGERLTTPFTAHDVGCMLELFKIARRFSGTFNADDYIDAAGYAGCAGEILARENTQRTD